jgi:methylthioribose-1-phosphate isomerase
MTIQRPAHPATIRFTDGADGVVILDQTLLPERVEERTLSTVEQVEEAIRSLRVRGAPLIGITAAMGVAAIATQEAALGTPADALAAVVRAACDRLARARPTAVNLTWALDRMRAALDGAPAAAPPAISLATALVTEATAILTEDREMCRRMGEHALGLLAGDGEALTLLTHCNAGSLATGGIGTALAPIYLAHEAGRAIRVFADETRPLLQGSRLTAWELQRAGIDVTVISDGMPGALMARERVDAVLVGADRIAANGDVANKIGTYGLAVLARHHGVPFYVLAPTSTVDLATPTGSDIEIEHRDPDEIRRGFGRLTAPDSAAVWSPAFDVTPADLIAAIVTERGVHLAPFARSLGEAVAAAERDGKRLS